MDESAFCVGPASEPNRYRLTHLLGSGGEGEVWRAVRADDGRREVAVKIDAVPEAPDNGWADRLDSLASLQVPGLVQVEEAFVGVARHRQDDNHAGAATHRYVVMNHVEGLTLRTWLDEHPDASPRQRIRILRRVAFTLSSLHRGTGSHEPFTHGDVKPTNIIIGRDERPVLVDLGLLRATGAGPASGRTAAYSSPELRNPDATPSPRADTFSFAVTAMETLTALTPPLGIDGNLDLPATRARLVSTPALRFRPLLRRQLLRSLTPAPELRPGTPVHVFAGRTVALVLVPVLVVLGAGGSAIAVAGMDDTPAVTATVARTTSTVGPTSQTVSPTATVDPPSAVPTGAPGRRTTPSGSSSSTATPAAPVTAIDNGSMLTGAFQSSADPYLHTDCDTRSADVVVDPHDKTTLWGSGRFSLTLFAKHDLRVLSVTSKAIKTQGPRTVYQKLGLTCPVTPQPPAVESPHACRPRGQQPPYRTQAKYLVDADKGTWTESQPQHALPFGVFDDKCAPPSEVSIVADDCSTNVDYQVTVTYQLDGDADHVYRRTFPPVHMRARMAHGMFLTDLEEQFTYPFPFSGGPDGCARSGVKVTRPYRTVTDGIYVMLVDRIHKIRASRPGMTTNDGIAALIKLLEQGGTRTVGAPYSAADLLQVCHQAQADPARWRGTCGPPDPSPAGRTSPLS